MIFAIDLQLKNINWTTILILSEDVIPNTSQPLPIVSLQPDGCNHPTETQGRIPKSAHSTQLIASFRKVSFQKADISNI